MEGDIDRSHPAVPDGSAELLMKGVVGGVLLRDQAGRFVGNWEGAEICDGKGGAGVATGDDATDGDRSG